MVRALWRISEIWFIRLLGFAGALNGSLQLLNFLIGQIAECSRLQRSQLERADAHALEFFHQLAEVLEHQADLVLAPFGQLDLVPGVGGVADQAQSGGQGAAAHQRNAVAELLLLVAGQQAGHLHDVGLGQMRVGAT